MSEWTIDKSAVADLLDVLLKRYQVLSPVQRNGILDMGIVDDHDQVVLDWSNTKGAPKELFFPRSEVLFTYQDGEIVPASLPEEQRVVFGIRPCDARSSVLLDNVFDDSDFQDPYYVNRRKRTILVGLACNEPSSTCFCSAVGGGPFATDGLDVLLTDLGDRYLAEALTEQGEALLDGNPSLRQAAESDAAAKAEIAAAAEEMVSGPSTEGIKEKLDGMYDSLFWDNVHLKCLGCGVCTYLCPTCHCFDIVDEGNSDRGRRVRNWDTCQFSLFTHHTSGHNPRPTGKERMRQRVMHKFNYFVSNFQEIGCVGCGRCVRECPVNLDIRAVITEIGQAGEK